MDAKLDLRLPEKHTPSRKLPYAIILLLCAILAVVAVDLFVTFSDSSPETKESQNVEGLGSKALGDLALRLEKQGLMAPAIETWQEYLNRAVPGSTERAKIWYRIGKLFQGQGNYEAALASYYRSEGLAKISELEPEMNRRTQESLEALGKFSALRYELADRVTIGSRDKGGAGQEILAEIGGHRITKMELDQRIEELIEVQLAPVIPLIPEQDLQAQKESLLKRFSTSAERQRLLNQIVIEELLYLKAVEDKIKEEASLRRMLQQTERSLLAREVMTREEAARINITEGDLRTYYDANPEDYMQAEQARISHIQVGDQQTAELVLEKLEKGESFAGLAKQYSLDESTRDRGGDIDAWSEPGNQVAGIGTAPALNQLIFNSEADSVVMAAIPVGEFIQIIRVNEKKDSQQKNFDEVRQDVFRVLRTQKENEVRQELMARLKEQYNVVIHFSQLRDEETESIQKSGKPGDAGK